MSKLENVEPTFVLGDGIGSVALLRCAGEDVDIANAARVSYDKWSEELDEKGEKLIGFMLEHNHSTPFEHNQLTFRLVAPLYVVQEILRHRTFSYNQLSARYMELGEYYTPGQFRIQSQTNRQGSTTKGVTPEWDDMAKYIYGLGMQYAFETYQKLLEHGVAREIARGVMPHGTYSKLIMTGNLHNFLKFFALRMAPDAQWEIRQYAEEMYEQTKKQFPVAVRAWEKTQEKRKKALAHKKWWDSRWYVKLWRRIASWR